MAEPETPPNAGEDTQALKSKLDEEASKRKAAESALDAIYHDLLQEVPEQHRDMIPPLAVGDQIKWIRAALKKGIFSKESRPEVKVDQSRPRTSPQTQVNLDDLKPEAKIAFGYKTARV